MLSLLKINVEPANGVARLLISGEHVKLILSCPASFALCDGGNQVRPCETLKDGGESDECR